MSEQRLIPLVAAIDAVLAIILVVLLAVGGAPADVKPSATVSTTSTTATAPDRLSFAMPSGNVACEMTPEGVTCMIIDYTYTVEPVPDCDGNAGQAVVLSQSGVTTPCPDHMSVVVDDEVLAYGNSASVGDYTCTSADTGITCTRTDGAGFRLSRSTLRVLT